MRNLVLFFLYGFICNSILIKNLHAFTKFVTNAKSAIVLECSTGKFLFAKNAEQIISSASLTKLMTLYIIF